MAGGSSSIMRIYLIRHADAVERLPVLAEVEAGVAAALADALRAKRLSSLELTDRLIARIAEPTGFAHFARPVGAHARPGPGADAQDPPRV